MERVKRYRASICFNLFVEDVGDTEKEDMAAKELLDIIKEGLEENNLDVQDVDELWMVTFRDRSLIPRVIIDNDDVSTRWALEKGKE